MFKNYLKMAFRNLYKNKVSSFINIFGLSTAIGLSIVSFLFVDFYYNRDTFHEYAENIYLVQNTVVSDESEQIWGNSPVPLGPALKADFSQIERVVRLNYSTCTMRHQDKIFKERLLFADNEFLDIFTFPLKYGGKNAFSNNNSIILSEDISKKYFGEINPIGENLTLTFQGGRKQLFVVKGVAHDLPKNASFTFNVLVPYQNPNNVAIDDLHDWSLLTDATFIQLANPGDIQTIKQQADKYIKLQNASNIDRQMTHLLFEPLLTMAQNDYRYRGSIIRIKLYPAQIFSMLFLGLFLLSLACFNYMNISIIAATRRFKEIGIRKVVGGDRLHIIFQFLGENTLSCLIALTIGIALAHFFFVPGFNNLFGILNFDVDLFSNGKLWVFLISVLLLSALGAGAYPAFYMSSYKPAGIFRGKQKFVGNNLLTKIILGAQLVLSFTFLVFGVLFIQDNEYQRNRDWGFKGQHVIYIPVNDKSQFVKLKNTIESNPNVLSVAGSVHHILRDYGRDGIQIKNNWYDVAKLDVGFNYLETMGIRLKQGRLFKKQMGTDSDQSVIVNEAFVKNMNWQNAIGKEIVSKNKRYNIIGVVEDFHYGNLIKAVEPAILRVVPENEYRYLVALTKPGTMLEIMKDLKNRWRSLMPDTPFAGFFQDDILVLHFHGMAGVAKTSSFTALIALIITCMGIYAMISMNVMKKMKEISIHKVMGASVRDIVGLVNKGFLRIFSSAIIISIPISYFMVKMLLDSIWEHHRALDATPFVLAFGIITISIALTIFSQIYKAAVANPIDALRDE